MVRDWLAMSDRFNDLEREAIEDFEKALRESPGERLCCESGPSGPLNA